MNFGVSFFPSDRSMAPGALAAAAEARGFESVFFPEHTHIPARASSRRPSGAPIPPDYARGLDPFVALGAAAVTTKRIRIGTGICLVVQRDPIVLAKEVASVDLLSGGRFLFGVGAGWNDQEMANHGTDYARRFTLLRERIEAMQAIWSQEEASYEGEFVRFDAIWSWPKPVQRPHPPILLGGDSERNLARVVRYADGWLPHARDLDHLRERMGRLQVLAREAGREPIPVSLFAVPPDPALIERFREDGAARCIFALPSAAEDAILPELDRLAELARAAGGTA